MAFSDRVTQFLNRLPVDAALSIRNTIADAQDMEVVYRAARTYAQNVKTTLQQRRTHSDGPSRFGKSSRHHHGKKPAPSKTTKPIETDEDLDLINVLNLSDEQLYKLEMARHACYRCGRRGHFVKDCKVSAANISNGGNGNGNAYTPAKQNYNTQPNSALVAYENYEKDNELYAYDYDDYRTYSPSDTEIEGLNETEGEEEEEVNAYLQEQSIFEDESYLLHLKA